jgi:glutaredoxin
MPADVEIFYAQMCDLCHKAMDYFDEQGIPYQKYEVQWDSANSQWKDSENAQLMYERCGSEVDFVPQIFINGEHIKGWNTLEPMIESGEFKKLLES